jgi:hypothetical protein
MTRTISLIIGIATAALAVGVPTALGEGRLAGSLEPADFWNYESGAKVADSSPGVSPENLAQVTVGSVSTESRPDWFERAANRAIAGGGTVVVSRPDSHDIVRQVDNGYLDAAARAQRIDVVVPTASSDAHERSAPPRGEITRQTDVGGSGTEIELPQVGIGFGFGLLLALGLYLTMRYTRGGRELAH